MESITDVDVAGGLGGVIAADKPCVKCGYNLRGLRYGAVCPECGTAIRRRGVSRFVDNLTSAPMWYLRTIAAGLAMMTLSVVVFVVWIVYERVQYANWAVVSVGVRIAFEGGAAALWAGGAYVALCRRPLGQDTVRDPVLEHRVLRLAARAVQGLALVCAGLSAAGAVTGTAWLSGLAGVVFVALLFGTVPLCVYLSSLADWAGDTGVGGRLRAAAWMFAVCGTLALAGVGVLNIMSTGPVMLVAIATVLASAMTLIGVVLLVVGLLQLTNGALWALRNSADAAAREIRIAERAKREEEEKHRRMDEMHDALTTRPVRTAEPLDRPPPAAEDEQAIPLAPAVAAEDPIDAALDAASGRVRHAERHVRELPDPTPAAPPKPRGSHRIDRTADGADPYALAPEE